MIDDFLGGILVFFIIVPALLAGLFAMIRFVWGPIFAWILGI